MAPDGMTVKPGQICFIAEKSVLQFGLTNYRHKVIGLSLLKIQFQAYTQIFTYERQMHPNGAVWGISALTKNNQ